MGWLNWILGIKQETKKVTKAKAPKSKTGTAALLKAKVPNKAELTKLSKVKLEKNGRENAIELDRRLVKIKLVNQLHATFQKG